MSKVLARFAPILLLSSLFLIVLAIPVSAQEERHQDHEELRALLKTATEALNARNFDALAPHLYRQFSITTVDQKEFSDLNSFKSHYAALFSGDKPVLKDISLKPVADKLTVFAGDNTGVCWGTSTDTFTFTDGETRTMTSRWTATVVKDEGKWKIMSVHFGANFMDNPVTQTFQGMLYKIGGGALAAGIVLGGLIGWVLGRRK